MKSTEIATMPSGQLLDSLGAEQGINQYSYELREIMVAMRLEPTMKHFAVIATDLSRVARKDPPWTKKYIHSVYHQWIEVSPALAQAIDTLAQMVDDEPAGVAGSVYVKVLAQQTIPEGVLIPAAAQVVKCARPGCPVWFVKVNPLQRYHDPECRRAKL